MRTNPRPGTMVQVWYRKSMAALMPHHGKFGRVLATGRGTPRNHVIEIDGEPVVVPCGNLR
jgi:hypothetical protein